MKKQIVQRVKDYETGIITNHVSSPIGADYALCTYTLDADPEHNVWIKTVFGKITCADCLKVIAYCKSIE